MFECFYFNYKFSDAVHASGDNKLAQKVEYKVEQIWIFTMLQICTFRNMKKYSHINELEIAKISIKFWFVKLE